MAYEKVADLSTETVVKIGGVDSRTNKPNPTRLEGYYVGSRGVTTQNGPATIHVFQTPKGNVGAWGTKDLNDKLGQVSPGTMTLVEYKGKKRLAGGKSLHSYEVAQDKDNTIEVSGTVAAAPADDYSDDSETSYSTEAADEDDNAQAMALAAAERKAKVEALLKKGNKSAKN